MKYNEINLEECFIKYHTEHIASVCDGDTKEIKEMEE